MMYLLDANVLSEFRKESVGRADGHVTAWARSIPAESMFLSTICILEIGTGTLLMERHDKLQGALLRSWMDKYLLPTFSGRILVVDTTVAFRCAILQAPNPRSYRDALIAATALVHGMTVVTRNVRNFAPTGVAILNPWEN